MGRKRNHKYDFHEILFQVSLFKFKIFYDLLKILNKHVERQQDLSTGSQRLAKHLLTLHCVCLKIELYYFCGRR